MKHRKSASIAILILVVALFVSASAVYAAGPPVATYTVTITNLTTGQPFTPPVLATHRQSTNVFEVGDLASNGVQQVAENGAVPVLVDELNGNQHVYDVQVGAMPLVPAGVPGSGMGPVSDTYTITSANGAKYLSIVSMLICTNDGFAGLDSLRLPKNVGDSTTVLLNAYDAGTEINTEDFADIVPPCQGLIGVTSDDSGAGMSNPALAEGGVIHSHVGIQGGNDLLPLPGGIHGWTDPVGTVEISRVN